MFHTFGRSNWPMRQPRLPAEKWSFYTSQLHITLFKATRFQRYPQTSGILCGKNSTCGHFSTVGFPKTSWHFTSMKTWQRSWERDDHIAISNTFKVCQFTLRFPHDSCFTPTNIVRAWRSHRNFKRLQNRRFGPFPSSAKSHSKISHSLDNQLQFHTFESSAMLGRCSRSQSTFTQLKTPKFCYLALSLNSHHFHPSFLPQQLVNLHFWDNHHVRENQATTAHVCALRNSKIWPSFISHDQSTLLRLASQPQTVTSQPTRFNRVSKTRLYSWESTDYRELLQTFKSPVSAILRASLQSLDLQSCFLNNDRNLNDKSELMRTFAHMHIPSFSCSLLHRVSTISQFQRRRNTRGSQTTTAHLFPSSNSKFQPQTTPFAPRSATTVHHLDYPRPSLSSWKPGKTNLHEPEDWVAHFDQLLNDYISDDRARTASIWIYNYGVVMEKRSQLLQCIYLDDNSIVPSKIFSSWNLVVEITYWKLEIIVDNMIPYTASSSDGDIKLFLLFLTLVKTAQTKH